MRIAIFFAACFSAAPAFAVVLDDFDSGSISLASPSTTNAEQTNLPAVAGGERLWRYSVIGSGTGSVQMTVDASAGTYHYLAPPTRTAASFGLSYNGGNPTLPAMDLDLSADGSTGWAIDFAYANFPSGAGHLDITMGSKTGTTTGGIYYYQPINNSATPFSIYLPFSEPPGYPYASNLDPHHVTSFGLGSFNGNLTGGDFVITSIHTAVPEPCSLVLSCAGALWMLRRRPAVAHRQQERRRSRVI